MQLVMTDFTGTEIKKEENKTLKNWYKQSKY
jgi:hypothetical protein